MDTVKIILLLSYLLAAFLGIAGITISLLARKKGANKLNNAIVMFLFGMLIMCGYDWFIYLTNYSFLGVSSTLSMRLGACLIALLFAAWLDLEHNMVEVSALAGPRFFFRIYAIAYAVIWFIISVFFPGRAFYTIKFLLLCSDIILLIMMLTLSVVYIGRMFLERSRMEPAYMIIVTTMLTWNYFSFIWGEMSVYWGNSDFIREPLDFTIIFWLIVNIATIVFVYKVDFSQAYELSEAAPKAKTFDLEAVLDEMKERYSMTNREIDILRLVYQGLSNVEIADELFISKSTVKSHIYNAFRKADVRSRSEIIVMMHAIGMGDQTGAPGVTEDSGSGRSSSEASDDTE